MDEMDIEIVTTETCGYCVKAKQKCRHLGLEYRETKLGIDITREELLERVPTARTVPQIFIDGEPIGGYDDLVKYLEPAASDE